MDFDLIERHPWATGGIVLGGGFLLYLIFRRNGSSAAAQPGVVYQSAGTDPNAAALAASQSQTSAYIAGLQIQGATQVSLAQIGADVSKQNTAVAADAANRQTDAQLQYGVGTLDASVKQSAINAGVQIAWIQALVDAFRGPSYQANPATVNPPVTVANPGNPTNPTAAVPPPQTANPVTYPYQVPPTTGGTNPGTLAPGMTAPVIPGGTQLVPQPAYANCDPRDVACVNNNQQLQIGWMNATIAKQAENNRNQCYQNAELSRGLPGYTDLLARCASM